MWYLEIEIFQNMEMLVNVGISIYWFQYFTSSRYQIS